MNTMDLRNWEKHRLVAQVRALRRLPPNIWLPELNQLDRDLFNLLLHLPNKVDLFVWLEEKHGDLIARVLLWIIFDRLRLYVHGVHCAVQTGRTIIADRHQEKISELLKLPEVREQLQQLIGTHPTTVDLESLYAMYRMLRNSHEKNFAGSVDDKINDEIWTLLNELFQLPEKTDPLHWIQDKHSDIAAFETLRYILTQVRPPDSLWDRQVMKTHRLEVYPHSKKHRATLYEMAIGQTAFALTLRIFVPRELFKMHGIKSIIWEGVESVVDDLGYHYLVYRVQDGIGYRFWKRYLLMRLLCYPAIDAAATKLTLSSSMTSLVVRGFRSEGQHQRLKSIRFEYIGDLTWSITLPE